ncbi:hypothetical protein K490DRAFT_53405 [Saccharata proteae CBS 121410]|uniref:Uncharacterized protein n=1 Tax=Saccharata proteae CBS 121410 TaxID=1314787 RepID=A0A9P4I317_9PEZI|nr:hypothetical protein K490DRAFT_53405 [Saccharata proteae CBS 121410]
MPQQARRATMDTPRARTGLERPQTALPPPQPGSSRVTSDQVAGLAILDFLEEVVRDGTIGYSDHPGLNIARMSITRAFNLQDIPLDFSGAHTARPLRYVYKSNDELRNATREELVKTAAKQQELASAPKVQSSTMPSQRLSTTEKDKPGTPYGVSSPRAYPSQQLVKNLFSSSPRGSRNSLNYPKNQKVLMNTAVKQHKPASKSEAFGSNRFSNFLAETDDDLPDLRTEGPPLSVQQICDKLEREDVKHQAPEANPQKSTKSSSKHIPNIDDDIYDQTPSTSSSTSPDSAGRAVHRSSKSESLFTLYSANRTISSLYKRTPSPPHINSAASHNFLYVPRIPTTVDPLEGPTAAPFYLKYFCSSATQLRDTKKPNTPGPRHLLALYYNENTKNFELNVDGQTLPFPTLSFYDAQINPHVPGTFAVRGPTPKCTKLAIRPDPRFPARGPGPYPKSYDLEFKNFAGMCGFVCQYREVVGKEHALPLQQLNDDAEMDALFVLEAPVEKMGLKSSLRFMDLAEGKDVIVDDTPVPLGPGVKPYPRPPSVGPPSPRPLPQPTDFPPTEFPPTQMKWAVEGTVQARDTSDLAPGPPFTYRVRGELVFDRDEEPREANRTGAETGDSEAIATAATEKAFAAAADAALARESSATRSTTGEGSATAAAEDDHSDAGYNSDDYWYVEGPTRAPSPVSRVATPVTMGPASSSDDDARVAVPAPSPPVAGFAHRDDDDDGAELEDDDDYYSWSGATSGSGVADGSDDGAVGGGALVVGQTRHLGSLGRMTPVGMAGGWVDE